MIGDIREAMVCIDRVCQYHDTAIAIGGSEYHHMSEADDARLSQLLDQIGIRLEEIHEILYTGDQ